MRRKDAMTRIGTAALALAALASAAPGAAASAIVYDATGEVGNYPLLGRSQGTLTGPAVVGYSGVKGGALNLPGPLDLGNLVVTPSSTGATSTYKNVPFTAQFVAPEFHKVVGTPFVTNGGPVIQYDALFTMYGHLDGTVQGDGRANLTATVDGFQPWNLNPVTTDRIYLSDLPFPLSGLTAGPTFHLTAPAGGGSLTLAAQAVPEPSTLAFAGLALAGLLLRRRALRRG